MTKFDENSKIPVRVIWFGGLALVTVTSWLVGLSAGAKQNADAIAAIQADRSARHDKYNENLIEIKSDLAIIKQELKDINPGRSQ